MAGDFIRAETVVLAEGAAAGSGQCSRVVLKKDVPLEENQRVIKLFANKAKSWQQANGGNSSSGGGGGGGGGAGAGLSKQKQGMAQRDARDDGKDSRQLSLERMLKRLHKSSDRQGKSKGGKGTGQDRRTGQGIG